MNRLLAVLGALCISFSAIFIRLADVSPSTAAFFRTAYALPILVVLWFVTGQRGTRSLRTRMLTVAAGLLIGISFTLWNHAIDMIGAGLSTVLGNTQVVFVGLLAWVIYRERPSNLAFLTIPIVFVGVALSSGLGRPESYGQQPVTGTIFSLINAVVYALYLIFFRSLSKRASSPVGPVLDASFGSFVMITVLAVLTDDQFSLAFQWPAHFWLMCVALIAQTLGWLLIATALPRLPSLETSVILLLQPLLTVFWSYLIFREVPSELQWLGVVLVLAGVGLLSIRGSVRTAAVTPATQSSS
ncbi:MAG: DMT family transporter [Deinococcota bacterium]